MDTSLAALTAALEAGGRDARAALPEMFARFPDQAAPLVENALMRWLDESQSETLTIASSARSTLGTAMWSLGRGENLADAEVLRRFEPTLVEALIGSPALRPVLERLRDGLGTPTSSEELLLSLVSDPGADRRSTTLLDLTCREESYLEWPPGVLDVLLALAIDTDECESDHMLPNHLACRAVTLLGRGPSSPPVADALSAAATDWLECMRDAAQGDGSA